MEFGKIVRLVKSSGFLRYRVDISGNFRLSRFPKFQFRARVIYYRASLHAIRGSK